VGTPFAMTRIGGAAGQRGCSSVSRQGEGEHRGGGSFEFGKEKKTRHEPFQERELTIPKKDGAIEARVRGKRRGTHSQNTTKGIVRCLQRR